MTKRSKTVNFPRFSLEVCEQRIAQIPIAKPISKSRLLEIIGYTNPSSGPAGSAFGALRMFGLIVEEDELYTLSPLGRALRAPVSECQRRLLRVLSFLVPEKFVEMYLELKGTKFEPENYLRNLFIQSYTTTERVASVFEKKFIESGLHAGVIVTTENIEVIVLIFDQCLSSMGIQLDSFVNVGKELIEMIADDANCESIIASFDTKSKKDVPDVIHKEDDIDTSHTPIPSDMSDAISGSHDWVKFSLDEGDYIIKKTELKELIIQKGEKLSKDKFEL